MKRELEHVPAEAAAVSAHSHTTVTGVFFLFSSVPTRERPFFSSRERTRVRGHLNEGPFEDSESAFRRFGEELFLRRGTDSESAYSEDSERNSTYCEERNSTAARTAARTQSVARARRRSGFRRVARNSCSSIATQTRARLSEHICASLLKKRKAPFKDALRARI